jgi:hypothetical protein
MDRRRPALPAIQGQTSASPRAWPQRIQGGIASSPNPRCAEPERRHQPAPVPAPSRMSAHGPRATSPWGTARVARGIQDCGQGLAESHRGINNEGTKEQRFFSRNERSAGCPNPQRVDSQTSVEIGRLTCSTLARRQSPANPRGDSIRACCELRLLALPKRIKTAHPDGPPSTR